MCRPVLLVLCSIISLPAVFLSKELNPTESRLLHDEEVATASHDLYVDNLLHNYNAHADYLLPIGEHKFTKINTKVPTASSVENSYSIREVNVDDFRIPNSKELNSNRLLIQVPDMITNPDIVSGRILPEAGGLFQSRNSLFEINHLSPNLIHAEIPGSNPRVIGTIGSGSLGYTPLGNGLYAVGSGSLGFAAQLPSQTGKGSITVRNRLNQRPLARNYRLSSLSENSPHVYPKPIDLKKELSEQTI